MTQAPPPPTPAPRLGKRLMLLADQVHPFVYRDAFPQGVPAVDAVLAAGDLPGYYLEFLATKLTVPVIYVHGNHANEYVNEGEGRVAPRGVISAHGRVVDEAGLRVAGWGGVPRYRQDGEGQYSAAQARWGLGRLAWQARRGVDVLLTHAPPTGPHAGADHAHRGCEAITTFMARRRPAVVVHGHIHEYEGRKLEYTDPVSGARVLNAYGYRVVEV
ncbi:MULTISPECIES: metallophosphoesterase family protein [Deinococcus]|uniref:metallophosphoesterase family protein n=1 Tax=Deinococcus TaxID=1298 RepID=UPI001CCE9DD3|nr:MULTISPECIES: metallophosphoesterase [Deinococcus]MBZ9716013.1 metallophosphoesterase [Deinococcus multiflagellatus]